MAHSPAPRGKTRTAHPRRRRRWLRAGLLVSGLGAAIATLGVARAEWLPAGRPGHGEAAADIQRLGELLLGLDVDEESNTAVILGSRRTAFLVDLDDRSTRRVSLPHWPTAVAVDPLRRIALSGTLRRHASVLLLDLEAGVLLGDPVRIGRGVRRLAVEPASGLAVALDLTGRRLHLFDVDARQVLASLATDGNVADIAVHGGLGEVYALQRRSRHRFWKSRHNHASESELLVLALVSLTEKARVALNGAATGIVVDEALNVAVAAGPHDDRLVVVDLLTHQVTPHSFPGRPRTLGLQSRSHLVVVASRGTGRIGLLDLRSGATAPDYHRVERPGHLAVSPRSNLALVIPHFSRHLHFVPLPGDAPRLRFEEPVDGGFVMSETPRLELRWEDGDDDVLPETLSVLRGGAQMATDCLPVTGGASCTPVGALGQGPVALTATVDDAAGHVSEPAMVSFTIDSIPPQIQLLAPLDGLLTASPAVLFQGLVSEPAELTLGGANVTVDGTLLFDHGPVPLVEGVNVFELAAEDPAGNRSVVVVTLTRDSAPPVVTAPPDALVEASAVLTPVALGSATAVDAVSGALAAAPDTVGPFPLGVTSVVWTASDEAGNTGVATQSITVQDTTPPSLTAPADIARESADPVAVDLGSPTATDIFLLDVTNDAPALFPVGATTVMWTARDTSGNATTAEQHVTVAPPATGGDWGQPQPVEYFDAGNARNPRLSMNADGKVMVVWRQHDGSRNDVGSRLWEPGTRWRDAALVEDIDIDSGGIPGVRMLSSGEAFATWVLGPSNRENGWVNRFDPATGWGQPALIEDSAADIVRSDGSSVIALGANRRGDVFATWDQAGRIFASRYLSGTGWEPPVLLDAAGGSNPHLVVDEAGNATVVFVAHVPWFGRLRGDVWSNRFEPGTGWLGAELVETVDLWESRELSAFRPQIGVDAAGNVFAAWQMNNDVTTQVWANRWSATGGWGEALQIGEETESRTVSVPRLAVQADGRALIVWQGNFQVVGAQIRSSTFGPTSGWSAWELVEQLAPLGGADHPSDIATDGLGNSVVVRRRAPFSNENHVEVLRHSFDTGWGPVEEVAFSNRGIGDLRIELHSAGDAFVTWHQANEARTHLDVLYSRFNASGDNEPPTAFAGHNIAARPGGTVTLDGSRSSDSEGAIASYSWRQAAGAPVEGPSGLDSPQLTFTVPAAAAGTTLELELTVTDEAGAPDNDTVLVTVLELDTTPPVVTPPFDITTEATAVLTPLFIGTGSAFDNADGALPATPDPTGPFPLGTTIVTWSATDSFGNTGTAEQLVTLRDTTPPGLSVPPDIDVESDVPLPVDLGEATATDIFEPVTITNDAPGIFPIGATIVTWTAGDANGNARAAEQTVTVGEPLDLIVTSPLPGTAVQAASILVTGTLEATMNTGVVANWVAALIEPGAGLASFTVSVPLTEGANTIEVVATTLAGSVETEELTVTRLPGADFEVAASTTFGLAPLDVEFRLRSP